MPALLALRLVTYLMVCTGVAALYLANLIGAAGAALVVLAILVSWGHEHARERGAVRPALGWSLVAAAAVAIAVDLFYLAYSLLDGMVHLLLFLILLRLFARRGLRDLRDAGLLSFFMLVAAASISFSLGFLLVYITFLLLGTWMLILNHVVTELEQAGWPGDAATVARRVFFRGPLTQVSLVAAAITLSLAAGLFFVIPRVGQAALPLRASIGRMVTGFSDSVDLGSFGDIESDRSVIMRVYLADEGLDPATLPGLRWRGVVFDQFDGRTWSSAAAPRRYMHRTVAGDFGVGLPAGRARWCARRSISSRSEATRCSRPRARCGSRCARPPSWWMTWAASPRPAPARACTTWWTPRSTSPAGPSGRAAGRRSR